MLSPDNKMNAETSVFMCKRDDNSLGRIIIDFSLQKTRHH